MKICPKCDIEHTKSGIFCSRNCANSRGPRTKEFKEAVRKKLTGRTQTLERKLKTSGEKNGRWNGGVCINIINCKFCGKEHSTSYKKVKFCSKECWQKDCASNKSEFEKYKVKCSFKFNAYDYPEWFDLQLIEEYGWYSAANRGNNQLGVQRDHRYSIVDGFKNGIDASIISHPANCKLLIGFDNQKKRSKSSITLEELLKDIEEWNKLISA